MTVAVVETREVAVRAFRIEDLAARFEMLSYDELERAARLPDETRRLRFVAVRSRVRAMLADLLDVAPHEIRFRYGPLGRPSIAWPATGLGFNLSHTNDLCVLAIGPEPVGVDVETVAAGMYLRPVAAMVMADSELDLIERALDPDDAFARIWVRKEAWAKAGGSGLTRALSGRVLSDPEVVSSGLTVKDLDGLGAAVRGAVAMPVGVAAGRVGWSR
jgi:4'-phosphopantetheinyl transferase